MQTAKDHIKSEHHALCRDAVPRKGLPESAHAGNSVPLRRQRRTRSGTVGAVAPSDRAKLLPASLHRTLGLRHATVSPLPPLQLPVQLTAGIQYQLTAQTERNT